MVDHLLRLRRVISTIWVISQTIPAASGRPTNSCRSYCGNLTVDYPFGLQPGCGHGGFRDLLFCVNDALMLHIASGSYRVADIDYAYRALTLLDPDMSTCDRIAPGGKGKGKGKGNGFVVEPWRAPYLTPTPDNLFMLLGCRAESPLFQGFPGKHLPCRNVSGMSCEDYLDCPAWDPRPRNGGPGAPPECCGVPFEAIRAINLTRLRCAGYSSAFSVAPLKVKGASEWAYGIRVGYSVGGEFCRECEATAGVCGYDGVAFQDLCICDGWNSTTNCDTGRSPATSLLKTDRFSLSSLLQTLAGLLIASVVL
ncbi:hypothetical protein H6P81_009827 [Aristolochia fimbriata]|uniref:Wall-associated receptor kinase galacturonan-binding domain-containing protein n=1 Tax=Aristolochia fimbriata TaxID=158543 RepID=A0AAV7EQF3_ARIFI|nr:hypothetical protein H6P81_009827 [Aristolochia fimbriata]